MKILHLVTLATPDGAFGGPLRVALNQATELRRRGHEAHIAAGWRGTTPPPAIDGVPAKLFTAYRLIRPLGFSGLVSPGLARWLLTNIASYDAVHVHAGRDLISVTSLAIARAKHQPYVTQTHGMIQPDQRLRARLMDSLAVRRLLLGARQRFVLTEPEQNGLQQVLGSRVACERLMNGAPPVSGLDAAPGPERDVLFCARLQERKRPVAFVEMAAELTRRGICASYAIVGPDEGQLVAVLDAIAADDLGAVVRYEGALDYHAVLGRMSRAHIYVLPSVHEPFPMSLLEALSLGLPSVCTDTCDIADMLRQYQAAIVTDGSVPALADAVEAILKSETLRFQLAEGAKKVASEQFSMESIGTQLEQAYSSCHSGVQ